VTSICSVSGGRIKGVCDTIAEAGFRVIMPDLYGDSKGINDMGGFGSPAGKEWLKTFNAAFVAEQLESVYAELESKGIISVGSIGFCWGAYVVFKMSAAGKIKCVSLSIILDFLEID
jgi:dienelactone hydrolase